MYGFVSRAYLVAALFLLLLLPGEALSQSFEGVLTGQYNTSRTGTNSSETILTPSNVNPSAFGLLFSVAVDGDIFAEPLYVPNLKINGSVHNVVFVATVNNSIYAFDADEAQPPLWHLSLGTPVNVGLMNVGILGTPVIDIAMNTIFLVTLSSQSSQEIFSLHAVDILTGTQLAHTAIRGAVPGTGDDTQSTPCTTGSGGVIPPPCIPFATRGLFQRPALLEDPTKTTVYLAFGTRLGNETTVPYHGWLFGYQFDGSTFTQTMIFNSTQNATQSGQACSTATPPTNQCGHGGGIWMSGRGPGLDPTGVYIVTGNGGYGGPYSGNWGESALRLSAAGIVVDAFTPYGFTSLNLHDLDLGDAGGILFTSTNPQAPNLMVSSGKTGGAYVLNRETMGGYRKGNNGAVQAFTATSNACGNGPGQNGCYEIHSMALWPRADAKDILYVWGWGDSLRVWDFNPANNRFTLDAHQGAIASPNYPGGGLTVSANGGIDGIVWAVVPQVTVGRWQQGALYAFDATNVSTPLWSSTDYWFATKFTTPVVANGKVYVPSSKSPGQVLPLYNPQLRVYGLCSSCAQDLPTARLRKGRVVEAQKGRALTN